MSLQPISVFAEKKNSVVVAPVDSELYSVLQEMQGRAISPTEVSQLLEILPKEIVTIAGTTAATTGAVISTPILISVCIVLATLGVGLTVYNFWKYYNSMYPTENSNGTVTFHPTYTDHGASYTEVIQGLTFMRDFNYIDTTNYDVGDFICLGTFDSNISTISTSLKTTQFFAYYKVFDPIKGTWDKNIVQQGLDSHNVIITIDSEYVRPYGYKLPVDLPSLKFAGINTYWSVWTPQYELFRTAMIDARYSDSKIYTSLFRGNDHWSSLPNAVKGGHTTIRTNNHDDEKNLGKYSIYIKKLNDSPQYIGAEVYSRVSGDSEIKIPEHISPNEDYVVNPPKVEEWFTDPEPLKPKPDLINPVDPDPNFKPYPETRPTPNPLPESQPQPEPEPEPEPDPKPEPEPQPQPEPDPNPDFGWPDANDLDKEIDFSPILISLEEKFPFCIPFDLNRMMQDFKASKEDPVFFVDMSPFNSSGSVAKGSMGFEIDLTIFEKLFLIVRYFILVSFVGFIIIKTRDLIRG